MQYTDDASKKQRRVDRLMGHWLPEENACYLAFLECSEQSFQAKGLRRRDKVFKAMAKTIRTRDPEQCRSHHQKMLLKATLAKASEVKVSPDQPKDEPNSEVATDEAFTAEDHSAEVSLEPQN